MPRKSLGFESLPSLAIGEGDTSPNPGASGVWAWSSTLGRPVFWDGASWQSNAATATRLATASTINGVAFDGSANINLPTWLAPGYRDTVHGDSTIQCSYSGCYSGTYNCAYGFFSQFSVTTGVYNCAFGAWTLSSNASGTGNSAFGGGALSDLVDLNNCTGLGNNAQVTASNQVQLGDAATTTYVYGTVQNRSDLRDKADVRDTVLGLDFVTALRPVDYRWDMRELYRPARPDTPPEDASAEQMREHERALEQWRQASLLKNIRRDGRHKRKRYHHGLIAQQVREVMQQHGVYFGGLQDHSLSEGGDDVLSIGYDELIAPLIKAVQQLKAMVDAQAQRIAELEKALSPASRTTQPTTNPHRKPTP